MKRFNALNNNIKDSTTYKTDSKKFIDPNKTLQLRLNSYKFNGTHQDPRFLLGLVFFRPLELVLGLLLHCTTLPSQDLFTSASAFFCLGTLLELMPAPDDVETFPARKDGSA